MDFQAARIKSKEFETAFGDHVPKEKLVPMLRFLKSSHVDIHPQNRCNMRDFFVCFDTWCRAIGYGKVPHQKYASVWSQFSIKMGQIGNQRGLFGVCVVNDNL